MKIAVMGAGAVGCYYGGMLARAGHEVTLIARPVHVAAVSRHGLLLDTLSFREHVPLQASTDVAAARGAELVLFCVKSTDTDSAAAALRPHLAPQTQVLSLQNGVDNAERLQALIPQVVTPAVVYVATEMAGPGHVKHHGRGELVIGASAGSGALAQLLIDAGVPVLVSDNVVGTLWTKLIVNCAYNALSAITGLPYGPLVRREGIAAVVRDVVLECLAVAQSLGVTVQGDPWAAVDAIPRTMPTQSSSTAQDLRKGKRTEIDHLNGYVVRQGERLGVATPANRLLHVLVKALENPAADAA
ncbi:ketopantoate reductase family protein [Hydrogenophaga sp. OTU3427]|uniref:ketopantoate reductase family protein n=1 Tax=Hydrogenophaga sp. OTU3427 TaxID=3043856 RepID=UPI00313AEBE4